MKASKACLAFVLLISACLLHAFASQGPESGLEQLRQAFHHPPPEARVLMRWWWFGPAVQNAELDRELHVMKDAGIGGVEIQPVYPLQLDGSNVEQPITPYLSAGFLAAVTHVSQTARELGLRVDVTLGSGWPYGGPRTPITEAAGRLRFEQVSVPEGTTSVAVPALENGETLIAVFLGGAQVLHVAEGRVPIPSGLSGSDLLSFFIQSHTGQQVKRSAVGAEGFVLDHYSRPAIEDHLASVATPLLAAFGGHPPYSVFSDSLEVYGSDWTPAFLAEFQKRRGYDLTPYLLALVKDIGPETSAIRHDWSQTLSELVEENYLQPIHEWAQAHKTLFRSQTYGEPPVILSSNRYVDLPEGEHGPYWRRFSAARWASSAAHLYGKPVVSAETWTWLHSPSFRATPLDLKAEADRHFLQGINQLVGHGWPYSPTSEGEPGRRFYAAAALNDHNPWFDVMPDIMAYLQRVSFLLRQGQPANDIAIYVPTDDALSRLQLGKVTVDETVDDLLGPLLIPAVLDAGYNFDFIDDRAIAENGIPYKLLIVPGVERMPRATLERLQTYQAQGGALLAVGSLPTRGAGLLEERSQTDWITAAARALFAPTIAHVRFVPASGDVPVALRTLLSPDLAVDSVAAASVGFVHRKLAFGDVYFLANATNRDVTTTASIRVTALSPEWWDPFTGAAKAVPYVVAHGRTEIPVTLAPYESRILVFSPARPSALKPEAPDSAVMDLSSDWSVHFLGTGRTVTMPHLRSWTLDESTRFYSGRARYQKEIVLPLKTRKAFLDFGPGVLVEPGTRNMPGMHALLESPVREAAIVQVNGKPAGVIWHPPYVLDISTLLHAGANRLEITVGNLAINEMASQTPPDYTLLNLRYGERFVPQDMQNLAPLASGLLGPVRLRLQ